MPVGIITPVNRRGPAHNYARIRPLVGANILAPVDHALLWFASDSLGLQSESVRDVEEAGGGEAVGPVGAAAQRQTSEELLVKENFIDSGHLLPICNVMKFQQK